MPGKLDESELYQRITSTDPDERMPPPKSGKSLSAAEVARLKTWIEEGAEYQGHWAFLPPVRPPLPSVKNPGWCRNPIDRFILARLEAEGLAPSPEADKVTLIRRLSLDLIGLPPTIEEVDAFLADTPRRCLRQAGRAAARLAALRRALGPDLARCRPLCRLRRLRERQVAPGLLLPRLGHRRLEPRPALRPVHHRADRRRPAAGRDPGPGRRHRLPAQLDDQRGRGHRPRAVPHGGDVRPHGLHRQGHPGPDDPVRPVPQPQVRPAHAGRVLPDVRLPQQRPRGERRGLHARASR